MIRTQGYDGGYFILESGGGVTPISKRSFDVINQQNTEITKKDKQLQQYKSLVKTVDADNLPNGEVLIKSYNDVYLGEISLNTDNNLTLTECDDTKLNINNSTHYIEQKDLLKLITNK